MNWTIIIVLFVLSLILAAQVTAPNLFPSAAGGPNHLMEETKMEPWRI